MSKGFGSLVGAVAVVIVAVAGANMFVGEGRSASSLTQAAQSVRTASSNAEVDPEGVKEQLESVAGVGSETIERLLSALRAAEGSSELESLLEEQGLAGEGVAEGQESTSVDVSALEGAAEDIEAILGDVDFSEWSLVTLHEGVAQTQTYQLGTDEEPMVLILYDDPRYVTVSIEGQSITMSMPADFQSTMQEYLPYLNLLSMFLSD